MVCMRILLALLTCLVAAATAEILPEPEETAALLLSPEPAHRRRGLKLLETDRGRKYERAVTLTVARWASDRTGWIEELRKLEPAALVTRQRVARMLSYLRGTPRLVSVEFHVLAAPDVLVRRLLGPGLATVVSDDAQEWERWKKEIARTSGVRYVFTGAAASDDGEDATAEAERSIAYIREFEIKGGPGRWAADPVVDHLLLKTRAAWRPVLSADRRFATLRLDLTVADCIQPIATEERELDGKNKVKVQIPEVARARMKTTLTIPLSGHATWSIADEKGRRYLVLCRAIHTEPQRR